MNRATREAERETLGVFDNKFLRIGISDFTLHGCDSDSLGIQLTL